MARAKRSVRGEPIGTAAAPADAPDRGIQGIEAPPADAVELGSEASFPASDPPAWMGSASTTSSLDKDTDEAGGGDVDVDVDVEELPGGPKVIQGTGRKVSQ